MSRDNTEIEIKFTATPIVLVRLRSSAILTEIIDGGGSWNRLVSTYHDTPNGDLERAGLSLRLREQAGRRIQTVKGRSSAGGAIERYETERVLLPQETFPAATGNKWLDSSLGVWRQGLRPIASSTLDRWSALIKLNDTTIECAFDFGQIEGLGADGQMRMAPLAELELELLDGDAADLFTVARRISEQPGVRLGFETKLAAARRTGQGSLSGLGKRPALIIDLEGTVEDAFRAGILYCAEQITAITPTVLNTRHPEGVHQLRVALRRFRAIERIFRRPVYDERIRSLARKGGNFARLLSPTRDWDVFLHETLPPLTSRGYETEGFSKLQARAEALRAEAWDSALNAIAGDDFSTFAFDLLEVGYLKTWHAEATNERQTNVQLFAAAALDDRVSKLRAVAARRDVADAATHHKMRIALKKLRYALQVFLPLYAKAHRKPYMMAIARFQEILGALNDAVIAQSLAEQAARGQGKAAMRAAGFIYGCRAAEAETRMKAVDKAWADFDAMAPLWRE